MTIRVLLVDDHEVVRRGLKALIDAEEDLEVVAEADTAADAVTAARIFQPDVAVLDVRLPDGSGVEACRRIRSELPQVRVLMLTSFDDDQALFDAVEAGADGYVLKQLRGAELVESIRRVGRGESILDPAVTAKVLARLRDPLRGRDPKLARLTPTEERILGLVAEGLTNRQIGERLGLAEKTVKNYVSAILSKLEVRRRAEAAAYYVAHRPPE